MDLQKIFATLGAHAQVKRVAELPATGSHEGAVDLSVEGDSGRAAFLGRSNGGDGEFLRTLPGFDDWRSSTCGG